MQDSSLEVESDILVADKLKGNTNRRKPRYEASSSSHTNPNLDKMDKMLESLTSEISKLKIENKKPVKGRVTYDYTNINSNQNPNNFRRNNMQVQILQRERNPTEDQKIKDPLQNVVMEEYDEDECLENQEDHIHCFKSELENSFLTQNDYEEALTNEQINELSDDNGVFQADDKNRYNLRSKAVVAK
jgi:hypothetical protein